MRILTYDEVDPYEVYHLTLSAFGFGLSEKWVRHARRKDPRVIEEYAIYAVEGGRPLAQVIPLKMVVRLTTGVETVGGIAGVCSHPSVWGRGYARRLMAFAHGLYRERDFRIATLATSRNIRGYRLYRKLGYVDLAPFYRGTRRIVRKPARPQGIRLRKATRHDIPRIHALFERHVRNLCGWTIRPDSLLELYVSWEGSRLDPYRIALRDGVPIGYLQTDPKGHRLAEEVIVPRAEDFRAAMRFLETQAMRGIATTGDVSSNRDIRRFRDLGYDLSGPMPGTTMALALVPNLRTASLPRLFGAAAGRFVHYPTDDF